MIIIRHVNWFILVIPATYKQDNAMSYQTIHTGKPVSIFGDILAAAKPEKGRQFDLYTLTWIQENRPFRENDPQRLANFEIIWIQKGSGSFLVDLQQYTIEEGAIYCFTPGQLRLFQAVGELKGYYISLSPEFLYMAENQIDFSFLALQYNDGKNLPVIHTDKEMKYELEDILVKMIKEMGNYFFLRTEILQGLLKIFMIYLSRGFDLKREDCTVDKDTLKVKRFMDLLKKNFTTHKMVADYARELCLTPSHLNKIVKKVSGFPASYHIQQQIILEAKRQAIYYGLSMKEVASSLGFDDYLHFSKFFKNNSGMNFTCFKNTMVGGGASYSARR